MKAEKYLNFVLNCSFSEYWDKFVETGWLNNYTDEDKAILKRSVQSQFEADSTFVSSAFAEFDMDYSDFLFNNHTKDHNPAHTYTAFLKFLKENSRGYFCPENINEIIDKEKNISHLSFEFKSKIFSVDLVIHPFNDYNIFWIVNQALKNSNSPYLFCIMEPYDTEDDYIKSVCFVNPDAYAKAIELSILPSLNIFDIFLENKV